MVFFFIILNKDKQDIQFITSFSTFLSPPQPYSWLVRPPSQRSRYDEMLVRQIRRSFAKCNQLYKS